MQALSERVHSMRAKLPTWVGLSTAALSSNSFGLSAGGFVVGFCSDFGFNADASVGLKTLVYSSAAVIGINVSYRLGVVMKIWGPEGLEFFFGKKTTPDIQENLDPTDLPEEKSHRSMRMLEGGVVALTLLAGTAYGGLVYLGCSHVIPTDNKWIEGSLIVLTIVPNIIINGAIFGCAWVQNIRRKTLFSHSAEEGRKRIVGDIFFSLIALMGLGSTMTLGALGLSRALRLSKGVAYTTAVIGFLGEMPFTIKQSQLWMTILLRKKNQWFSDKPVEENSDDELDTIAEQMSAPKKNDNYKEDISNFLSRFSLFLYCVYSFVAIYGDIGDDTDEYLRVLLGLASTFASLVSCLKDDAPASTDYVEIESSDTPLLHTGIKERLVNMLYETKATTPSTTPYLRVVRGIPFYGEEKKTPGLVFERLHGRQEVSDTQVESPGPSLLARLGIFASEEDWVKDKKTDRSREESSDKEALGEMPYAFDEEDDEDEKEIEASVESETENLSL